MSRVDLKTWLKGKGRNKYRLAKKAGVHWRTIHRLVGEGEGRRTRSPRRETVEAIEKATGGEVTAAELLGLTDTEAA